MANILLQAGFNDSDVIAAFDRIQKELEETEKEFQALGKVNEEQIKGLQKLLKSYEDELSRIKSGFGGFGSFLKNAFVGFAAYDIAGRLKDTALQAVNLAGNVEGVSITFETLIGNADKARQVLAELDQFSIATPFTPEEVRQAAQALLPYIENTEELIPTLRRLGDISAGLQIPFGELSLLYGRAVADQVLYTETLNQFADRGIPIYQELGKILAEDLGKQLPLTRIEIVKLASEGKISFEKLEEAFKNLTDEGGRFAGLTEAQSTSFKGLVSTLEGVFNSFLTKIGNTVLPALKSIVSGLIAVLNGLINFGQTLRTLGGIIENNLPILTALTTGILALNAAQITAALSAARLRLIVLAFNAASKLSVVYVAAQAAATNAMAAATAAWSTVQGVLTGRVKVATVIQAAYNAVLRANPIGLVITAIGALTTALVYYNKNNAAAIELERKKNELDKELAVSVEQVRAAQAELNGQLENFNALSVEERKALKDKILLRKQEALAILEGLEVKRQELALEASRPTLLQNLKNALLANGNAAVIAQQNIKDALENGASVFGEYSGEIMGLREEISKYDSQLAQIEGRENALAKAREIQGDTISALKAKQKLLQDALEDAVVGSQNFLQIQRELNDVTSRLNAAMGKQSTEAKKAQKEISKLAEEYKKLKEELSGQVEGVELEGLIGVEKLQRERQIALRELQAFKDEISKAQVSLGLKESFEAEFKALEDAIERDYRKALAELRDVERNERLKNLDLRQQIAEEEIQQFETTADELFTAEERKQQQLIRIQRGFLEARIAELKDAGTLEAQAQIAALQTQLQGYDQQLAAINQTALSRRIEQSETLALQEVELITESGSKIVSLEEKKEQERLAVQIRFAQQRLALLKAEKGEDAFEVKELENQIAILQNSLKNAVDNSDISIFESLKNKLQEVFQLDDKQLQFIGQQLGSVFNAINANIRANTELQIKEQDALIAKVQERVDTLKSQLAEEEEARRNGYANSVDTVKTALEQETQVLKEEQEKRQKLEEEAAKKQARLQAALQAANLITAATKVVSAESSKGIVALVTVAATIAGLLAIMASTRAAIRAASAPEFEQGGELSFEGLLKGKRHKQGGIDALLKSRNEQKSIPISLEDGEFVQNRKAVQHYGTPLFEALNKMNTGKAVEELYKNNHLVKIMPEITKTEQQIAILKLERQDKILADSINAHLGGKLDSLIKITESKPQRIPSSDGKGYVEFIDKPNEKGVKKVELPEFLR